MLGGYIIFPGEAIAKAWEAKLATLPDQQFDSSYSEESGMVWGIEAQQASLQKRGP